MTKINLLFSIFLFLLVLNKSIYSEKCDYTLSIKGNKVLSKDKRIKIVQPIYDDIFGNQDRYNNFSYYFFKGKKWGIFTEDFKEEFSLKRNFELIKIYPSNYRSNFIISNNKYMTEKTKFALIDNKGKLIVDLIYDELYFHFDDNLTRDYSKDLLVALMKNKKILLNSKGEKIINIDFDELYFVGIDENKEPLLVGKEKDKVNIYNKSGNKLLKKDYENVSTDLFIAKPYIITQENKKYSYRDLKEDLLFKGEFDEARIFINRIARVKKDGFWFFINDEGKDIFKKKFEEVSAFVGEYATVKIAGKTGLINRNGEEIIPPEYDSLDNENISEDIIIVKLNEKYGYFDLNKNKLLTEIKYTEASKFKDGTAIVKLNQNDSTIINNNGDIVFSDRNAVISESNYGEGKFLISDLALFNLRIPNKYYINQSGEKLNNEYYGTFSGNFKNNLAKVEDKKGNQMVIDNNFRNIFSNKFKSIWSEDNRIFIYMINKKKGLIDITSCK